MRKLTIGRSYICTGIPEENPYYNTEVLVKSFDGEDYCVLAKKTGKHAWVAGNCAHLLKPARIKENEL